MMMTYTDRWGTVRPAMDDRRAKELRGSIHTWKAMRDASRNPVERRQFWGWMQETCCVLEDAGQPTYVKGEEDE